MAGRFGDENDDVPEYFQLLSRGGLTVLSVPIAEYVSVPIVNLLLFLTMLIS